MKKALLLIGIAGLALSAPAGEVESLVSGEDWSFSIRPEFKLTSINGEAAQLAGIRMGPALDRTLYLGLAAYTVVSSVDSGDAAVDDLKFYDWWTAGLDADYTLFSAKVVHGSLGLFLGGGRLDAGGESSDLFVAEPGAHVYVNVTRTLELGAGLGYRYVNGSGSEPFSDSDLSGVTGTLGVRWTEL